VKQGASAASPLLFPETVYNAPASHLSAQLGLDGACYTLVGDSTIGLTALKFAEQLLALGDVDRCVVVACEEIDWILCEAYRDWRLAGTPLAESAPIAPIEFVRIVALARIMMPTSYVRLSAGRSAMSDEMQALCFFAGANSIFVGDTLLTAGNPQDEADRKLFRRLGLQAI